MAVFKSAMPQRTGSAEGDINALYNWAEALVAELRTMLYTLDSANVKTAKRAESVSAAGITGRLAEYQLPESVTRLEIEEGEISLTDGDGTQQAAIHIDADGNLHIDTIGGKLYINGIELP